jgi:hypothetical protein
MLGWGDRKIPDLLFARPVNFGKRGAVQESRHVLMPHLAKAFCTCQGGQAKLSAGAGAALCVALAMLGARGASAQRSASAAAPAVVTVSAADALPDSSPGSLPDAPAPHRVLFSASSVAGSGSGENAAPSTQPVTHRPADARDTRDCPYLSHAPRQCNVNIAHLAIESSVFITFQNAGNLYTGYWYRYETMHGKWWDRYVGSVEGWRWNSWSDNNPFLDDYVGHPVMGSITNYLWIQNDPKGKTVEQGNNWPYWRSRLRALAYTSAYSTEWKLGPIGEASIGHNGDHFYYDKGVYTNETGWVELITTPFGGFGWTLAEDAADKHILPRLENFSRNPLMLTMYQFLTPTKGVANFLRFRPPWYRDTRVVKADSFWSDPTEEDDAVEPSAAAHAVVRANGSSNSTVASPWGGKQEIGAWWGLSLNSGHLFGNVGDVKYMPMDMRYSYRVWSGENWALRYSPEMTALAMLDEPVVGQTDPELQRRRSYGSGLSPEGVQFDFFTRHRVEPFLSQNAGLIYFINPVLTAPTLYPRGSHLVSTVDFGAGINIFHLRRQAITLGYRYQHLANVSPQTPNSGTDANTFYLGVSRFRTGGHGKPVLSIIHIDARAQDACQPGRNRDVARGDSPPRVPVLRAGRAGDLRRRV